MPRTCSLCRSGSREGIDHAVVDGDSLRDIAGRFGTSRSSVFRHRQHVSQALMKAAEVREVTVAGSILERLQRAHEEAWAILEEGRRDEDQEVRLRALARIERQLELEGRLLGELQAAPVVNLVLTPDWLRIRSALLDALAPFPEARAAVASALRTLDAA